MGDVFKAIFLVGFFWFMRMSNLAPHLLSTSDLTRYLTGADVFYTSKYAKLLIKWSKTYQDRNKVQIITLPKLKSSICPVKALKRLRQLCPMSDSTSLFQYQTSNGWVPMTDTTVRKIFQRFNMSLGLRPHYFTFHVLC